MTKPFFSLVLPTRNRPDLLIHSALPSILDQSFEDFEVIICDNASDQDQTKLVADHFDDPRIKYFRSDEWIAKETFYLHSIDKAQGRYMNICCDDDVFTEMALEKSFKAIQTSKCDLVTFNRDLAYYPSDYGRGEDGNRLTYPKFDLSLRLYESQPHLEMLYKYLNFFAPTPTLIAGWYEMNLFRSMQKRAGNLFPHGHMGDWNAAVYSLTAVENFAYLEDPLKILMTWSDNTVAQLHDINTTAAEYQEWIASYKEEYLSSMPYNKYLWPNCIAASMADMSKSLNLGLEVKPENYWSLILSDLDRLQAHNIDVTEHRAEFDRVCPYDFDQDRDLHGYQIECHKVEQKLKEDSKLLDYQDDVELFFKENFDDASFFETITSIFLSKSALDTKEKSFKDILTSRHFFNFLNGESLYLALKDKDSKNDIIAAFKKLAKQVNLDELIATPKSGMPSSQAHFIINELLCSVEANFLHTGIVARRLAQSTLETSENQILIFGTGKVGEILSKILNSKNVTANAFLDSNPELSGQYLNDIKIQSLDSIEPAEDTTVVITSIESREILVDLVQNHWDKSNKPVNIVTYQPGHA